MTSRPPVLPTVLPENVDIGQRVYDLRQNQNMSRNTLAARIGATCDDVRKYENGAWRITPCLLLRMAHALGVDPIELFKAIGPSPALALSVH